MTKSKIHNGALWLRLSQTIKVESAFDGQIELRQIRKFCRDIPLKDLDSTLQEMSKAGRLHCSREWTEDGRMIETYTYND